MLTPNPEALKPLRHSEYSVPEPSSAVVLSEDIPPNPKAGAVNAEANSAKSNTARRVGSLFSLTDYHPRRKDRPQRPDSWCHRRERPEFPWGNNVVPTTLYGKILQNTVVVPATDGCVLDYILGVHRLTRLNEVFYTLL